MPKPDYTDIFIHEAESRGMDWVRLKAQAIAESNLDANAVSGAGAMGLTQFMPATWMWIHFDMMSWPKDTMLPNPFDPAASIRAQAVYMRHLLRIYQSNWRAAWAAYNWGPGNLNRSGAARTEELDMGELPLETASYIERIERTEKRLAA